MSRPWMPLYVADYLADTSHLNCAESGAYLHLIMHYWQRGSLPNDPRKLASIARATPEQWYSMSDTIAEFFGVGWTHARIDRELEETRKAYERRALAGKKGGNAKASNAKAMPQQCSSNHNHNHKIEDIGANAPISPEPAKAAPAVVIGLPTVSDGDYPVSESDIAEWASAFPAVDVPQQLAVARQWLIANPTRRKTKRGMRKFIVSWLDRRQNSGPAPQRSATGPPPGRRMNAVEAKRALWDQINEQAGVGRDNGDAERLPAGGPRLLNLVADAGKAMQWPK